MPVLIAVGWGLAVGLACGGSFQKLTRLRLRGEMLMLPCFVVQAVVRGRGIGVVGSSSYALLIWTVVCLVLAACLLANRFIPGCYIGALGLLFNVAVVLANGGMPVGPRPGTGVTTVLAEGAQGSFYLIARSSTLFGPAGDTVPMRIAGDWLMFSMGDILLMIGVCVVVVWAMRQNREFGHPGGVPE